MEIFLWCLFIRERNRERRIACASCWALVPFNNSFCLLSHLPLTKDSGWLRAGLSKPSLFPVPLPSLRARLFFPPFFCTKTKILTLVAWRGASLLRTLAFGHRGTPPWLLGGDPLFSLRLLSPSSGCRDRPASEIFLPVFSLL